MTKNGKDRCTHYHDRLQMRLATGQRTLDDRKPLIDNATRC